MQTIHPQQPPSSFENLFLRYVNGQIADQSWKEMMQTFDHKGVTVLERLAYARFMSEVIEDSGSEDLHIPKPEELEELLVDIRS